MKTFDGDEVDDPAWYHAGLMTREQIIEAIFAEPKKRRIPYKPDDARAIDQTPYLAFADKDRTPKYQKEQAT